MFILIKRLQRRFERISFFLFLDPCEFAYCELWNFLISGNGQISYFIVFKKSLNDTE